MNPFKKYSISVSAESEVEEESEELAVPDSDDEVTSEVADMIERVDVIEEVKDDLIQLHQKLASMESNGSTFDDNHADLVKLMINKSMARVGGSVTDVAPSLESDDYIERTDIVASMEGVGEAISQAARAGVQAIIKALKTMYEFIKNKFSKIKMLKVRFSKGKEIAQKMDKGSRPTVTYAVPVRKGHGKNVAEHTGLNEALGYYEDMVKVIISYKSDVEKLSTKGIASDEVTYEFKQVTSEKIKIVDLIAAFVKCENIINDLENSGVLKVIEKAISDMEKEIKDGQLSETIDVSRGQSMSEKDMHEKVHLPRLKVVREYVLTVVHGLSSFKVSNS